MITETLIFLAHLTIVSIAIMASMHILWEKNSPLRMYALIIPSLVYMTFMGFMIGKLGVYNLTAMIVTCLASIVGLTLNFAVISARQSGPIWTIIQGMAARARAISDSSEVMGEASGAMSHGSAIQSATLEETSTSLKEVLSMTKLNTDKTKEMNSLVDETAKIISRMGAFMEDLTHSMNDINKASEETSKIIRTIDEIAFQTNLLALNAAVEAARAGASGAGFAVVAGEVRNLAMRSAEAAKNTADLIEGTVKKIKAGTDLVVRTNQEFTEVTTRSAKMGAMIAEITSVSRQQEQGIEQISSSMLNLDHITGENMAHAEECSALAEDTSEHAETMRRYLRRMAPLVGWRKSAAKAVKRIPGRPMEQPSQQETPRQIGKAAPNRALPPPKKQIAKKN